MFDEIQRVFRKSLDAFRAELSRREPEDQVAELLSAMRRELTAARAALPALQEEVRRAQGELERERALLQQCERRGEMAERIGDPETARIAAEFAGRHRERVAVLEQKVQAARAEHALRAREAEEMKRKYQEADANRFVLLAQLRSHQTRERMRSRLDGASGPFADFARMEDTVQQGGAYADALEDLADAGPAPSGPAASDLEERLRELKRRVKGEE